MNLANGNVFSIASARPILHEDLDRIEKYQSILTAHFIDHCSAEGIPVPRGGRGKKFVGPSFPVALHYVLTGKDVKDAAYELFSSYLTKFNSQQVV